MKQRLKFYKVFCSVLAAVFLCALTIRADETDDQFEFEKLEDGTWSIMVPYGRQISGEVIIPAYHENIPVTAIGDFGFDGQVGVTRVEIPETITKLGYGSFMNCEALTSVSIPNTVKQISSFSFSQCQALKEISIPESVTQLEDGCFEFCKVLKQIELPESLSQIGPRCFYGCEALTNINLPTSLTIVGDRCFHDCKSLSILELPKSLTSIGVAAFGEMHLERLTIHCSLTPEGSNNTDDKSIFETPCKVKEMVFACEKAYLPETQFETEYGGKIIFSPEVRNIVDHAFENSKCQSLEFSEGLESIGAYAFKKSELTSVEIPSTVLTIGTGAFAGCKLLESIEIKDGLTVLGDGIFMGSPVLKVVKLPQTLTSIGKLTFFATGLEEIELPNSLTSIGDGAFAAVVYGWPISDELESIYGGSANDINMAWGEVNKLTKVKFPKQSIIIGTCAFNGMEYLTDFTLVASKIGDAAFLGCYALNKPSITITEEIGTQAFDGCGLTKCPNMEGVYKIGDGAFQGGGLKIGTLRIPDSVREIGKNAFDYCHISTLALGKGITDIGNETFQNISILTEVEFGNNIKSIGNNAFAGHCMASVKLPEGLEKIGDHAFDSTDHQLYNVTIPASVKEIGKSCFGNNLVIVEMMSSIPVSLSQQNLGYDEASAGKVLLLVPEGSKQAYMGNAMWSGFTIKERGTGSVTVTMDENTPFWEAFNEQIDILPEDVLELKVIGPWGCLADDFLEGFNNCMTLDLSEISQLGDLPNIPLANRAKLKTAIFPTGDENIMIGWSRFKGCVSLKHVVLPDNVATISQDAFADCPNLREINIPSKLSYIGSYAFSGCGLKDLDFSGSDLHIVCDGAFSHCNSLRSVSFGDKSFKGSSDGAVIINSLFEDCSNLKSVIMPNPALEELGENFFAGCGSLSEVELPQNLKSISRSAFKGAGLQSITLPETLRSIGEEAFADSGLRSVRIPSATESIGMEAFCACFYLVSVTLPKSCSDLSAPGIFDCMDRLRHIVSPAAKAPTISETTFDMFSSYSTALDKCIISAPNNEEAIESYMSDPIWSQFRNMDFSLVIESEMDDEWVDTSLIATETYEETIDEITQEEQFSDVNAEQSESVGALDREENCKTPRRVNEAVVQTKVLKVFAPVYDNMATTCNEDNTGYYVHVQPKGEAQILKVEFDGKDVTSQLKDGLLLLPAVKKSAKLKITTDRDGTDSLDKISVPSGEKGVIYDLMGRKVVNPGKGIYIKDGRKVVL